MLIEIPDEIVHRCRHFLGTPGTWRPGFEEDGAWTLLEAVAKAVTVDDVRPEPQAPFGFSDPIRLNISHEHFVPVDHHEEGPWDPATDPWLTPGAAAKAEEQDYWGGTWLNTRGIPDVVVNGCPFHLQAIEVGVEGDPDGDIQVARNPQLQGELDHIYELCGAHKPLSVMKIHGRDYVLVMYPHES